MAKTIKRVTYPEGHLENQRILVVDTHETGARIVEEMLDRFGADVARAEDVVGMWEAMQEADEAGMPFDLLLLDHRIDEQIAHAPDALSLEDRKHLVLTPTVAVMDNTNHAEALEKGRVTLKKPVRLNPLLHHIDILLGRVQPDHDQSGKLRTARKGRTLNILLVEDQINSQRLASIILKRAGHQVVITGDGREALERLRWEGAHFDLILMDLQMPHMGGLELTEHIRKGEGIGETDPAIPIVAVTAHAMRSEEERCMEIGMNGYLRKPYRAIDLLNIIAPFADQEGAQTPQTPAAGSTAEPAPPQLAKPADMAPRRWHLLCRQFLEAAPEHLHSLQEALQKQQVSALIRESNWFRSTADQLGVRRLKLAAMRLKGSSEMEDWEESRMFGNDLALEMERVLEALTIM